MSEKQLEQIYSELVSAIVKAVPEASVERPHNWRTVGWKGYFRRCRICRKTVDGDTPTPAYGCIPSIRPITLEDVLRAAYSVVSGGQLWVEMGGTMQFRFRPNIRRLDSLLSSWHLGKTLEQQSAECISFLHQLLCD